VAICSGTDAGFAMSALPKKAGIMQHGDNIRFVQ
jgi:hypothetical protein